MISLARKETEYDCVSGQNCSATIPLHITTFFYCLLIAYRQLSPPLVSTFWPLFPQFFDIPDHIQLVEWVTECVTILFLKATILPLQYTRLNKYFRKK